MAKATPRICSSWLLKYGGGKVNLCLHFGYCLITGDKIGIKRLKALPWATLAIETQEMFEASPQQTRYLDYRFSFSNRHNDFSTNDIHIKDFDYERDKTILSEDLGITCR